MCKSNIKNIPAITVLEPLSSNSYKASLGCYTYYFKSRVRILGYRSPLCCVLYNLGTVTTENLWRLNISSHPVLLFRNYSASSKIQPSNDSDFGNTGQATEWCIHSHGTKWEFCSKDTISVSRLFVTNDILGKSLTGNKGGCAKRCFIILV